MLRRPEPHLCRRGQSVTWALQLGRQGSNSICRSPRRPGPLLPKLGGGYQQQPWRGITYGTMLTMCSGLCVPSVAARIASGEAAAWARPAVPPQPGQQGAGHARTLGGVHKLASCRLYCLAAGVRGRQGFTGPAARPRRQLHRTLIQPFLPVRQITASSSGSTATRLSAAPTAPFGSGNAARRAVLPQSACSRASPACRGGGGGRVGS